MNTEDLRNFKSPGHVGFINGYEYFVDARGELFKAHWSDVPDVRTGYRAGRWEAPRRLAATFLKQVGLSLPQ